MKSLGQHLLLFLGAGTAGATLFVASFFALDFVWTHLVVTTPKDIGLSDGIMVVGGGFVLDTSLGLAGALFILYRYWPKRAIQ